MYIKQLDSQQTEDAIISMIQVAEDGVHVWEMMKKINASERRIRQVVNYLKETNIIFQVNGFWKMRT